MEKLIKILIKNLNISIVLWLTMSLGSLVVPRIQAEELPIPSFASPLRNVTIVAGREARIPCMVENLRDFKVAFVHYGVAGAAVLTVDTHVLTTNRRVSVLVERSTWTLVIANATIVDRGEYMCQISTVPPQKMYGSLFVQVPPRISQPPDDVTTDEGHNVTLECEATGDPEPRISWRKEEGNQRFGNRSSEWKSETLSLTDISTQDSGAYLCVASNGVPPAVSARVQIFVNYAPILPDSGENLIIWAISGSNLDIPCKFTGYPKPNITWTKLDSQAKTGDFVARTEYSRHDKGISRLYFRPITKAHFGLYKCLVANSEGEARVVVKIMEEMTTTTTTTTTTTEMSSSEATKTLTSDKNDQGDQLGDRTLSHFFNNYFLSNGDNETKHLSLPVDSAGGGRPLSDGKGDDVGTKRGETNPPNRYVQENPLDEILGHHYSQEIANISEEILRVPWKLLVSSLTAFLSLWFRNCRC